MDMQKSLDDMQKALEEIAKDEKDESSPEPSQDSNSCLKNRFETESNRVESKWIENETETTIAGDFFTSNSCRRREEACSRWQMVHEEGVYPVLQ